MALSGFWITHFNMLHPSPIPPKVQICPWKWWSIIPKLGDICQLHALLLTAPCLTIAIPCPPLACSIPYNCLSMPYNCLSMSYNCLSMPYNCLSRSYNCLSRSYYCLSRSYYCLCIPSICLFLLASYFEVNKLHQQNINTYWKGHLPNILCIYNDAQN